VMIESWVITTIRRPMSEGAVMVVERGLLGLVDILGRI